MGYRERNDAPTRRRRPHRGSSAAGRPRPFGGLATIVLVAAASLLLPADVASQEGTGTLSGRVFDPTLDAPVGLALVEVPSLDRRTRADGEGRFRLPEIPAGTHELRVSFLGVETTVRQVTVPAGEEIEVEIRVVPSPVDVADLEVSALSLSWFPGFQRRREERTGHFFTRKDIAERDPAHLTRLLRGAEGVRIGYNHAAHGYNKRYPQFYYRGPGRGLFCYPVIFVDGESIGPGQPYWHLNEISPERVLAMEVYYRAQDVPESIPYAEYRPAPGEASGARSDLVRRDLPRSERSRGPGRGVRQVLAGAGLLDGLRQRVPRQDEDLELARSILAGLYPELPRIEHCGAIFVWTKFYPYGAD